MTDRPRITIVGPGNFGTVLAISLKRAGYTVESVIARGTSSSRKRGRALAREIDASLRSDLRGSTASVIWICVPDSQISRASSELANGLANAKGMIALHSSGALTSDELDAIREKGAAVASAHPLMTFVRGSRPSLAGVPFAVEGDSAAVRLVRRIVRDLGGAYYPIEKNDKPAYHTWGTFASPLLTSLLVSSERVAELAGVDRKSAKRRMVPILLQTLANYASFGASGAFSGPLVRGDIEIIRKHLAVLRKDPVLLNVYLAMAQSAQRHLPCKNKARLKKLITTQK